MRLVLVLLLLTPACLSDEAVLERGPLGPATYTVTTSVDGGPVLKSDPLKASMSVSPRGDGAVLTLVVENDPPIIAELKREGARLSLGAIEGLDPTSAGETDLASVVSQLDPPLPQRPVRLRETWTQTRRITTNTVEATLVSRMKIVRYTRVAGRDSAELDGRITGMLKTKTATGEFSGTISGSTKIFWALRSGRLTASKTALVWTLARLGKVKIATEVA